MDREDFATLERGDTGWPMMRIPFSSGEPIDVEYNEGGNDYCDTIMIRTGGRPVRILVDGVDVVEGSKP
jgi:hypothetical protein